MTYNTVSPQYESYLQDESRLRGSADLITFPTDAGELSEILKESSEKNQRVTFQGARTGIMGGAVPQGGIIVNLSNMNKIFQADETGTSGENNRRITVQAGATLGDVAAALRKTGLFFPVNSTEDTATLGGVYASGATGLYGLRFGEPEQYFENVKWINLRGEPRETSMGPSLLWGGGGRDGAAAELTLRLAVLPKAVWGVVYFFSSDTKLTNFASRLKSWRGQGPNAKEDLYCAEYFDYGALLLLKSDKNTPEFSADARSAIYTELRGDNEDKLEESLNAHLDLFLECGGQEDDTWAENGESGVSRFRGLRHKITELIGSAVIPGCIRAERSFHGPEDKFREYLAALRRQLDETGGIQGAVYGHLLQNHLQAALLPEDAAGAAAARALLKQWPEVLK
ncbi:MAG: FAD-binding oxidoreductase [Clostridiales bacterium]|jgi:D-lactate dehydrogenase (cytochrome)|nr:FAD-binding oxidoreductase [Clostridiales bacterium]